MERLYNEKPIKNPMGELKDLPRCESCGRVVKISVEDYLRGELLCPNCASEVKHLEFEDNLSH